MKLTYFTVSNYRSITNAYKLDLKDTTILIGKNNEGKSNLINALNLAVEIIHYVAVTQKKTIPPRSYTWSYDFPLQLQYNKKVRKKSTDFRLDFLLDTDEIHAFRDLIGTTINGELSVFISIKLDGPLSFTIPKRGKNATALSQKYAIVAKFIYENIDIQYIPAIRSESDAYNVINTIVESEFLATTDEKYKAAEEYIAQYQRQKLKELSDRIKAPLSKFMPKIKSIDISIEDRIRRRSFLYGKSVEVEMDDGAKTRLSQKGDGVKSLTAMAILSQIEAKNRVIIVDEPENHLHPDAIRYLRQVLYSLAAQNQIIISTHNPIFVNRTNVQSNIIVDRNEARPAQRIDEVRNLLGVMMSDNLVYSDYVIVVEGLTDRMIITYALENDEVLSPLLKNSYITVRAIGGTNNLQAELYGLERHMCNYIVVLDNDEAGKCKANECKEKLKIENNRFLYFILPGMRESELEDLVDTSIYQNMLLDSYQIDINNGQFRNKSKKWSSRISEIAALSGRILDSRNIDEMKTKISALAIQGGLNLNSQGVQLIKRIIEQIKADISGTIN